MEKIWYLEINGQRDGPWSVGELKRDTRITPDTLAWREGFENWKPLRNIPELQQIFEDEEPLPEQENSFEPQPTSILQKDELVLEAHDEPPYPFLLFLLAVIIYFLTQLYMNHE